MCLLVLRHRSSIQPSSGNLDHSHLRVSRRAVIWFQVRIVLEGSIFTILTNIQPDSIDLFKASELSCLFDAVIEIL